MISGELSIEFDRFDMASEKSRNIIAVWIIIERE
jgi:hypothetical protein